MGVVVVVVSVGGVGVGVLGGEQGKLEVRAWGGCGCVGGLRRGG